MRAAVAALLGAGAAMAAGTGRGLPPRSAPLLALDGADASPRLVVPVPVLFLECRQHALCDTVPANSNNANPEGKTLRAFVEAMSSPDDIRAFFDKKDASFVNLSVNSIWETGHSIANQPANVRFTPTSFEREEVNHAGLPQFLALIEGTSDCPAVHVYHGGPVQCPGLYSNPKFLDTTHWGLVMMGNTADQTKAVYSTRTGTVAAGEAYSTRDSGPISTQGELGFTLAHEFGHSMGLSHPHGALDQTCCNLMGFACFGDAHIGETLEYDEGQRAQVRKQAAQGKPYLVDGFSLMQGELPFKVEPTVHTPRLCRPSAVSVTVSSNPGGAAVSFIPVYGTTAVAVLLSTEAKLTHKQVKVGEGAVPGCALAKTDAGSEVENYESVTLVVNCAAQLVPGTQYYAHVAIDSHQGGATARESVPFKVGESQ